MSPSASRFVSILLVQLISAPSIMAQMLPDVAPAAEEPHSVPASGPPDTEDNAVAAPVDAGRKESPSAETEDTAAAELLGPQVDVDVPSPASPGIEELTITSQRRAQPLQNVPVSVTAFSGTDLREARISTLAGISDYTPNLEIKTAFAASNPTIFIRGVGINDFNANAASSVAIYQDGVYMNSPSGQLFQMFDVEQVEVLRGPQGSLYGRNASAGAIRVMSQKPTDEFKARLVSTYGNFDALEFEGMVNVPVLPELLAWRAAFRVNQRDGYTKNRCANGPRLEALIGIVCDPVNQVGDIDKWVNDRDNWAARGLVQMTPTSEMTWLLNAHGGQNRGDAHQFQQAGTRPIYGINDGSRPRPYRDNDRGGSPNQPNFDRLDTGDPFEGDYNRVGLEKLDVFGASLTGNWMLDNFELTSITAYESNDRTVDENSDANERVRLEIVWGNEAWQVSQELSAAYDSGGSLHGVAGAFFLAENLDVDNAFDIGIPNTLISQLFSQDTLTWATFAHGSYEFFDGLISLEGGVRYNWEQKKFDVASDFVVISTGDSAIQLADSDSATWDAPTGDVSLAYKPIIDVDWMDFLNIYVKYSRGWKGGHFNGGAIFSKQSIDPVDPEEVDAVEAGLKSRLYNGRVSLGLTAFYYEYVNQQVFQLDNSAGGIPVQQLKNADARVYGIELDLESRPLSWVHLRSSFGWIESEYTDFILEFDRFVAPGNPPEEVRIDFAGNQLVSSPKITWSGKIQFDIPLDQERWGVLIPSFDWSFKDDVFFDPTEGKSLAKEAPDFTTGQEAYWLIHARLAYRLAGEKIEVAVWVRNILEQEYKADVFDLSNEFGEILEVWGEPRTFGITVDFMW